MMSLYCDTESTSKPMISKNKRYFFKNVIKDDIAYFHEIDERDSLAILADINPLRAGKFVMRMQMHEFNAVSKMPRCFVWCGFWRLNRSLLR
jgi:hypothetical protein